MPKTTGVLQGNSPENLLDGAGKGLARVSGLSCSESDQFSTSKGECSCDKHRTEASEAVLEGAGIVPQPGTPILVVDTAGRATTADQNDGDHHENDGRKQLEQRCPKLFLGVAQSTKDVDDDDKDPKYRNPYGHTDVFVPVLDRKRADRQFERQDDNPLEDLRRVRRKI